MTGQHADHDRTWRRFTSVTAGAGGFVLVIGMVLSYASLYEMAYNAGFDQGWITAFGQTLRPAHLFPLTLDVPVFVGYAGSIALAGRVSRQWAVFVLVSCGGVTVAAQMVDEAGLVVGHVWVRALIHGWPPLISMIAAHLFVKIVQALGYLTPPVQERARPSWPARVWAWLRRLRADIETAPVTATPGAWVGRSGDTVRALSGDSGGAGPDRHLISDVTPDVTPDLTGDMTGRAVSGDSGDTSADTDLDTGRDRRGGDNAVTSGLSPARGDTGADSDTGHDSALSGDMSGDSGGVVTPLRARRRPVSGDMSPDSAEGVSPDSGDTARRVSGDSGPDMSGDTEAGILARVRSGDMTQADAARVLGVHPRTVARRVRAGEEASR